MAERREHPAIADAVVGGAEEMNLGNRGADALDRRVGGDDDIGSDVRNGHRHVEVVGHAVGDEAPPIGVTSESIAVDCRNDVLTAAAQFGVVMREYGRHRLQVHALDRIERQPLIGEAERHAAGADGVRAFGEDGTEARRRSREYAEARIELIGEARRRRGQGQRHDLTRQRGAELGELALEALLKWAE